MKIHINKTHRNSGFSLVEMIGVLAIVAILASLLVPRVFAAINRAKINSSVLTVNTIKSAVIEAYSETGSFTDAAGNALDPSDLSNVTPFDDTVLLAAQLIDKPFNVKIGVEEAGANEHEVLIALPDAGQVTGTSVGFDFDGNGVIDHDADPLTPDVPGNDVENDQYVVYARIPNVSSQDALDFSRALDGGALSAADSASATADILGRVKYAAPGADGVTDVLVYIASR